MLYRIKRDYFDVENDAGEISPNRASSYYPSYMYFRNFIFSDGPGLSGMVDFWVVSHPAFTKPTYKVNTTAIHYAKNELRGTRYKFEDDRLEIYTQTMADQDAAEALEKKYAGKIRGIVKTIIIPTPGEAKKGLPPMPLTVKVKFSFVYMGRLWSVHRSIQTVQDDPDNPMSPWRYKINDADDIYRKYNCSDYETGRSITAGEYNPNGAKRAAERTLSEAGPERLKAAVEKGKVINPLPALALAIIKEMPTRAKKPSEAVPKDKGTLAPEGGPGPVEAAPSPAEAAPGTRDPYKDFEREQTYENIVSVVPASREQRDHLKTLTLEQLKELYSLVNRAGLSKWNLKKALADMARETPEAAPEPREYLEEAAEIRKILVSTVTKIDREQSTKPGYNTHALALYFEAVDEVMKLYKKGHRIDRCIDEYFSNPIAARLKKTLLSYSPRDTERDAEPARKPPKTEDEYWAEQKALQKKKDQEILDRPDIPDYDPDTDTAPEIPEYDPGEGEA